MNERSERFAIAFASEFRIRMSEDGELSRISSMVWTAMVAIFKGANSVRPTPMRVSGFALPSPTH
ncbi:hypothetical protein D3C71_1735830 [compost metagenome]